MHNKTIPATNTDHVAAFDGSTGRNGNRHMWGTRGHVGTEAARHTEPARPIMAGNQIAPRCTGCPCVFEPAPAVVGRGPLSLKSLAGRIGGSQLSGPQWWKVVLVVCGAGVLSFEK